MGVINDLKEQVFGGFIKYLEARYGKDPFDNDIWANRLWEVLYEEYTNAVKHQQFLQRINTNDLEKILMERKEMEVKKFPLQVQKKDEEEAKK